MCFRELLRQCSGQVPSHFQWLPTQWCSLDGHPSCPGHFPCSPHLNPRIQYLNKPVTQLSFLKLCFGGTHSKTLSFGVRHCSYSTKLFKTGPWRHIVVCRHFLCSLLFLPSLLDSVSPLLSGAPWLLEPVLVMNYFSCVSNSSTNNINWESHKCTLEPRKKY